MRQRRIHTRLRQAARAEKHAREQAAAANATREIPTALIKSAEGNKESVCRNVAVRAEEATSALPEIGDNNNVCLVIADAGFQPCLPFAHVVGGSQICVPVSSSDLQTTESVDQEEVDHARHCIGTVNSRCAILQNVDVIDDHKGDEVNVHPRAAAGAAQTEGHTFAIYQDQRFLRQQAAQVELDSAKSTVTDVQVAGPASLLWQKGCQVRRIANTQLLEVLRTIRVDRIRAGLFRCGNV